jgi:hypothetical protein
LVLILTDLYGTQKSTTVDLNELKPYMRKKALDPQGKEIDWPEEIMPKLIAEAVQKRNNVLRFEQERQQQEENRKNLEAYENQKRKSKELAIKVRQQSSSAEYQYERFISGDKNTCVACGWTQRYMIGYQNPMCHMCDTVKDIGSMLNHLREQIKSSVRLNPKTIGRLGSFATTSGSYDELINQILDIAESSTSTAPAKEQV